MQDVWRSGWLGNAPLYPEETVPEELALLHGTAACASGVDSGTPLSGKTKAVGGPQMPHEVIN
jgi:hypothetical protein